MSRSPKLARPSAAASNAAPPIEFLPPLRPHRGLFIALCTSFALWVAALVGIYLKTVYPLRHSANATTQTVPR